MILKFLSALCLTVCLTLGAVAQDAKPPIDYEAWATTAERAEVAIETARASDRAFLALREEIDTWRQQFQAAQSTDESRIETIREQIAALGPAPEEGATEAPEIAQRRTDLNEQLARLEAPSRTAEEAFRRANGIITEIDAIARERQADRLLSLGPTPLNPALWGSALFELFDSIDSTINGVGAAFQTESRVASARANLPLSLLLLAVAAVLLFRARGWLEVLAARIEARETRASAGLTGFVVSLGQVILPVGGVYALVEALSVTALYGPRGAVILEVLPLAGLAIFAARWLGGRLFPRFDGVQTPLDLKPQRRREGRLFATFLGIVFAFDLLIEAFAQFDDYPAEAQIALDFPILIVAGLMLFRIGQILRRHKTEAEAKAEESQYRDWLIRVLGRAAVAVGIAGPVLAAIGFNAAAEAVVWPAVLTLALLASLTILQEAIRSAWALIRGTEGAEGEALIPVLLGFAITIASLPIFALIWGTRVTDLTELWTRFKAGVTLGETTISPTNFATLAVVFVIGYMATRLVQGALRTSILPKTKIDKGGQNAIVAGLGYVGIFLAAILAINAAGIDLSSLAIVAGALSVGIGFGLQNIVSNFVSGIILLIERPISQGDWIEVGGQMGYVRDISVRSTRIETFDRTDVIIPNADLVSGVVTNWTRGNLTGRVIVPVGVAYGTDTKRVEGILREIAEAHPMVVLNPPPAIYFRAFGADSLDFEIRAILRDVNWVIAVASDMNHEIARRFAEEGIEIPFAQRDIWLRNPEVLGKGDPA